MTFTIAEFPEHESPGIWVASDVPAVVQFSRDRETWHRAGALRTAGTVGTVAEWPVVEVSGALRSSPAPLEAPLLWVGGEVVGIGTAQIEDAGRYRLGGLLRGLRGTPERDHAPGEQVMLIDASALFVGLHWAMVGAPLWWRCVPSGESRAVAAPWTAQGLVCPRTDGTRPAVVGAEPEPPSAPRWGQRWLVIGAGRGQWQGWGEDVATWLDCWVRERPEIGTVLLDLQAGERCIRTATGWVSL